MGVIRTLLAVSVLITHSDPIFGITLLNGDMAITCFFIMSGFLMALILDSRYNTLKYFYLNRALRIYPPYFFSFVFAAIVYFFFAKQSHDPFDVFSRLLRSGDAVGLAWAGLSNLTLIGAGLVRYAGIDEGRLVFPIFFNQGAAGGHNILLIPQSWTLPIELYYYILAPFILRLRSSAIFLLLLLGFIVNYSLESFFRYHEISVDLMPFFPAQLCYFLLGSIAYRIYATMLHKSELHRIFPVVSSFSFPAALLLIFFGQDIVDIFSGYIGREADLFYLIFTACVPFLFHFSRNSRIDQAFGELSYPIYLLHVAMVVLVERVAPLELVGEITLLATVALSIVYIRVFDRPLQAFRRGIQRKDASRKH